VDTPLRVILRWDGATLAASGLPGGLPVQAVSRGDALVITCNQR
jgi:hypothetical protein